MSHQSWIGQRSQGEAEQARRQNVRSPSKLAGATLWRHATQQHWHGTEEAAPAVLRGTRRSPAEVTRVQGAGDKAFPGELL